MPNTEPDPIPAEKIEEFEFQNQTFCRILQSLDIQTENFLAKPLEIMPSAYKALTSIGYSSLDNYITYLGDLIADVKYFSNNENVYNKIWKLGTDYITASLNIIAFVKAYEPALVHLKQLQQLNKLPTPEEL